MKIEREKEEFKPVIITLETKEELEVFHALIKGIYYFPELLSMINNNLMSKNKTNSFMDKFLPMLESVMKYLEIKC